MININQLYSACTYYQLIVAIQMKLNLFPEAIADIVIHNHSSGYAEVAKRLSQTQVFRNVWIATTKGKTALRRQQGMDAILNSNFVVYKNCKIYSFDYDEYYFYNLTCFNIQLYYLLKRRNSNLICRRFEEGYASLMDFNISISRTAKLQIKLEKIHRNPRLKDINEMYVFEPDFALFDDKHYALTIPKFEKNNENIKRILNYIFDYKEEVYYQKYIFFEESYFSDNVEVDDINLVLKIIEVVGKEKLMVKLHPRTPFDRFSKLGVKTIGATGIPWEVIIMNQNFTDKIFLTIASGSVLSPRIIFGEKVPTFMLYNFTNGLSPMLKNKNFNKFIELFKSKYGTDGFYIPNNFDQFLDTLRKYDDL